MDRRNVVAAGVLFWVTLFGWIPSASGELIHQWEFEEDYGDSVGDLEGLPIGLADFTDDARVGKFALVVNGGGDYVEILDSDDLQFTAFDSYSVTAWVKAAESAGWRGILTKGREAPPWYGMWIDPNGNWNYGASGNNLTGTPALIAAWVHVAIVQNGDLGTRELFVNGAIVASEVARDAVNFAPIYIGGAGSVDEWFVGSIDEVRIYDEALDAAGVADSMALPPPDCTDGPDTHCEGFAATDGNGTPVSAGSTHPPGEFTIVAQAVDDSGDDIITTVTMDNGVDPTTIASAVGDTVIVTLLDGDWTLSVTVDDDPRCDDEADDATCVGEPFVVQGSTGKPVVIHQWNFESEDFSDSVGGVDAIPMGGDPLIVPADDAPHGEAVLELTGFGEHLVVPEPADGTLRFTEFDSFTLTVWVKPADSGGWRGVVTKGRDNAPWYGIWVNPEGNWTLGGSGGPGVGGPAADLNVWTHVAILQDGARGVREMWINGTMVGTNGSGNGSSVSDVFIGGAGSVTEWFTGLLDDIRFYDGALDQDGILLSMEELSPPDCTDGPDTHCNGFDVTDRDGAAVTEGGAHPPGTFTANVDASDDSDNDIRTTLTMDNGVDPPTSVSSGSTLIVTTLLVGNWTLTVSVDDDPRCDDEADDATCDSLSFVVESMEGPPELVHQWNFEDEDFSDSIGDADGVGINDPFVIELDDHPNGGNGLELLGLGDHVEVPDPEDGSLDFSSFESYTVTVWAKPAPSGGWRGLVTKGRDAPPWYGIWANPLGVWTYGNTNGASPSATPIEIDVWTHLAIVQNASAGTREIWVDGILVTSASPAGDSANSGDLFIGGAGGIEEWFVGRLADIRVYRGALDKDGVADSMQPFEVVDPSPQFVRGDADGSGSINITDGIFILNFLFLGGMDPPCLEAADADDSGSRNITDGIYVLNFLFLGGANPLPPYPDCGPDPTGGEEADCGEFAPCV